MNTETETAFELSQRAERFSIEIEQKLEALKRKQDRLYKAAMATPSRCQAELAELEELFESLDEI